MRSGMKAVCVHLTKNGGEWGRGGGRIKRRIKNDELAGLPISTPSITFQSIMNDRPYTVYEVMMKI